MDPNVKPPKTSVDNPDHANPQFYPGVYLATIAVVDLCLCQLQRKAERSFSSMKRSKTPLRSTMTEGRLGSQEILDIHIDDVITFPVLFYPCFLLPLTEYF